MIMHHYMRLGFMIYSLIGYSCAYAVLDKNVYTGIIQKIRQTYLNACNQMHTVYKEIKEHKKIVTCVIVYIAFEGIGYAQGWRTPLYRLFVLPGELDAVHARIRNERSNSTRLQEKRKALQRELSAIRGDLNKEVEKNKQLDEQLAVLTKRSMAFMDEFQKYIET
jgi:septal ring factor EnvC (AmiA/AmiB activator)